MNGQLNSVGLAGRAVFRNGNVEDGDDDNNIIPRANTFPVTLAVF